MEIRKKHLEFILSKAADKGLSNLVTKTKVIDDNLEMDLTESLVTSFKNEFPEDSLQCCKSAVEWVMLQALSKSNIGENQTKK